MILTQLKYNNIENIKTIGDVIFFLNLPSLLQQNYIKQLKGLRNISSFFLPKIRNIDYIVNQFCSTLKFKKKIKIIFGNTFRLIYILRTMYQFSF